MGRKWAQGKNRPLSKNGRQKKNGGGFHRKFEEKKSPTFLINLPVPPVPSNSALRASLCRCWVAGPRRDIVVAQSLKCTVQSAQLKPPNKTRILCPHPPKKWAYPPTKTQILCPHPPENQKIWLPIPTWHQIQSHQIQNSFYNPLKKMMKKVTLLEPKIEKSPTCCKFENFDPSPQLDIKF